jgi:predicted nucleic acid-binding protein
VKVYVESNFVLELALLQEQHASCEKILCLCESADIQLAIPAYSLIEPYETLIRHHHQRKRIKTDLDGEIRQIARTAGYTQRLRGFQDLTALLIDSADEEASALESVRTRLLKSAEIIPLSNEILAAASQYRRAHDLSPQDAVVYASVLSDLNQFTPPLSCFLNRNSRDFDDPDIVEELRNKNCKLLPRFDSGYDYIQRFSSSSDSS